MYDLEDLSTTVPHKPVSPLSLSDGNKTDSSIHSPDIPVSARVQNIMMQYHDYTQQNPKVVSPVSPEDGHNYFDCPKVWERIVMHPRFDEVDDVDALCAQLNAKVRIVHPPARSSCCMETYDSALRRVVRAWMAMSWTPLLIRLLSRLLRGREGMYLRYF